jgi:uncharacterized protein YaaW (UPF0174 family)
MRRLEDLKILGKEFLHHLLPSNCRQTKFQVRINRYVVEMEISRTMIRKILRNNWKLITKCSEAFSTCSEKSNIFEKKIEKNKNVLF